MPERSNSDSMKTFNKLSNYIAEPVLRKTRFISNLKKYVIHKAFYSIEKYINSQYSILYEV
jgi:hypothetical protein